MQKKWNLQDIRPAKAPQQKPESRTTKRQSQDIKYRKVSAESTPPFEDVDIEENRDTRSHVPKRKSTMLAAVLIFVIFLIGFGVNLLLGGAEITVYPKTRTVAVQGNFTAHRSPQVDELGYELLTLEATGEKQVRASGREEVAERAQGKIFVYNTAHEAPQRLIKNTRFESPDGLIFRIQESIEIPGITRNEDGNIVPGSIVADVFAEETGEQYNVGPTRFTVPGLEGTEQFDTVYAESTTAFAGGFEGEKYIIDESEYNTAKEALDNELRETLRTRLDEEKPADFVLYEDAITFAYDELPATEYGDSLATIKERVRLQVPIFKESEFASFLAAQTVPDYRNEPVLVEDPSTLNFTYGETIQNGVDISTLEELEFELSGTAVLVWTFDEAQVKQDLLGKEKSETANIFKNYTSISNVKAEVRPFWTNKFPDKEKNIDIQTIVDSNE